MNFFERQKEIENTKETSLEEIKKNQESLKASVERMGSRPPRGFLLS